MLKLLNRLRRNSMQLIKKDYIINKIKKRKGKCKKCGQCCKGCKNLDKTNICQIYNHRPFYCHKQFPIDKLDKKVFKVKNCGYSFS
jgi:Fe-S-cluster containining protein